MVQKIVRLIKVEKNPKIHQFLVRVFRDLGKADMKRTKIIVTQAGVPFFQNAFNITDRDC